MARSTLLAAAALAFTVAAAQAAEEDAGSPRGIMQIEKGLCHLSQRRFHVHESDHIWPRPHGAAY